MKNKELALRVAGTIFVVVAIMHFLRLLKKIDIVMGSSHVPMVLSLLAFIGATIMALWMFAAANKK